jgi:hypothetical protein
MKGVYGLEVASGLSASLEGEWGLREWGALIIYCYIYMGTYISKGLLLCCLSGEDPITFEGFGCDLHVFRYLKNN